MSKAEVERVVGGYWDALKSGGVEQALDFYSDDLVFHYYGHNPIAGDHVGKKACLEVLAKIGRRTNRRILEVLEQVYTDERATVIARESFERGGQMAILDRTFIYRVKDGKIVEVWILDQDQQTVDRFLAD
jgi:uncharacterized protein